MTTVGKLTVTTPSDREIMVTRNFAAPRTLVYQAFTTPALLQRWLCGPPGWTMPVCEMDVKVGGSIRWQWRGPNGEEMGLRGTYREVVPNERLVHTEIFDEDWTGGETRVTWLLTEKAGTSTLAMTVRYSSREARDGALATPMTQGMEMGYVNLEALLAELGKGGADGRPASRRKS